MVDYLVQALTLDNLAAFLNSNFTAALAGAFAGAMAAQAIANRAKEREALRQEIRSTNAAIMVALTICNAGLALKKQLVMEICERYAAKRKELEAFQTLRARGEPVGVFKVQADLRTVQMPIVPVDVLRTQMYEKISATGRPLALMAALAGSVGALSDVLQKRTELIERFRALGDDHPDLLALYLGQPYGPGHVSEEFPDTVEAMHRLTDDVIFFSQLLATDLIAHGNQALDQYKKIAKAKGEKISSVDFTEAHQNGLMPDPANYDDWLKGFLTAPQQVVAADAAAPRA
jgi:hypothetical protein